MPPTRETAGHEFLAEMIASSIARHIADGTVLTVPEDQAGVTEYDFDGFAVNVLDDPTPRAGEPVHVESTSVSYEGGYAYLDVTVWSGDVPGAHALREFRVIIAEIDSSGPNEAHDTVAEQISAALYH